VQFRHVKNTSCLPPTRRYNAAMEEKRFIVPANLDGQRLDRALAALEPSLTRSQAAKLAKEGHVSLNGAPAKASAAVQTGQTLIATLNPPAASEPAAQDIALDILYADEHLLVINKAAGMVVHPAPGNPDGTLVNALLHHVPELREYSIDGRPGIVHRLDKGTTGALVVAKTHRALIELQRQFAGREVEKIYLALVVGTPKQPAGRIDLALGRHVRERKKISSVTTHGRAATTLYQVEAAHGGISALRCTLLSGRTHQIRVHCAESGWPLVGDDTSGGVRSLKNIADAPLRQACQALDRPALHAHRLAFTHPLSGKRLEFYAPIPDDLKKILALIGAENV